MTATAPIRTPARFVRIRGLKSSTHLNGELARLGKWLPQRTRWEVSLCDSRNVGPTEEVVLAIKDWERPAKGGKDKGEGAKGKGKGGLPKGASAKTQDNRSICFAYNRCEKCVQTPCSFVHCCWFCGGDHAGNSNQCPKKPR